MNYTFAPAALCLLIGLVHSVNIDEACVNNAACTHSNSYCRTDYTNCDNGVCACNDGYTANNVGAACLQNKILNAACSPSSYCLYGAECDTGNTDTCKCPSGEEFNTKLHLCVPTGTKAMTDICSTATECYGYSGSSADNKVECVAASGSSTMYCQCLSGYITENNACRKPSITEACTAGVGCVMQADFSDTSQDTETCQSNTCTCQSTSTQESVTFQGTKYKLCFTIYTQTKKADGASCTAGNECSSTFCDTCPGESSIKCLQASKGSMEARVMYLPCVVLALLSIFISN